MVAKSEQRRLIRVSNEPNIATSTAVSSVGSAFSNVCLASKTDAAGSSVTRLRVQLCRINE
jgi:hypothetical protein